MKLLLTGVNHKTAPVEVREQLAFPELAIGPALERLRGGLGISEALILSTCNRVEITVSSDDSVDARPAVDAVMRGNASGSEIYRYEGRDAIEHLFRVAASLDAMVVGEPQILGQMKNAYAMAKSAGTMNGLLEGVVSRAFSVAKRVRTETGIGQMAVSISYAAVELARKIFGSLAGRSVLLVGSGKMSELAARHLRRSGAKRILVTNRTRARADEMAALFNGTAVDYAQFRQVLPEVDIVITSSGSPDYVLGPEDMQRAVAARKNKPMFVIDIAVPRNVDPAVNAVDNVFLYDIDDLQGVVNNNLAERQKEAARAERIVAEEVDKMLARLKVQEVAPVIVSLQEQLESIRSAEVAKALRKGGLMTESDIDALTRAIVAKIAHGPIAELRRQASEEEGGTVVEVVRRVFKLH